MARITLEGTPDEIADLLRRLGNGHAGASLPENTPAMPKPLTRREIEVARLICQALTSEAIAARFVVSLTTIKKHRSNLHHKLGCSDREGLEAIRETWEGE